MSLRLRLTLAVSLVAAAALALGAGSAYAFAEQVFYQMAQEWAADEARQLAASADFLDRISRRSSSRLASVDRFAQTCFRIVSVARGFADPETGETPWFFPLSEEALRALQEGRPWWEIVTLQGEPVIVYNLPAPFNARLVGVAQVTQDIGDQARALRTLGHSLAVSAGLLMLFVFFAAWHLSGAALRPLAQMSQAVRSIQWRRNTDRRIHRLSRAPGEIVTLGASLNQMLDNLESSLAELERRLADHQQFVADAAHELRTPLATIRGNLGLLRRSAALGPDEREAILRDALDESERMTHLLDELLTLSSVGAGRKLRCEPVDVRPLVEDACRKIRVLAPDRIIAVYAPEVVVMADAEAVRQVLLVLLDNAVKYTLAGGRISVSVVSDDAQVHIRVRDDGVGIDEAHLSHIFDRYYRADASRLGTGLGLSIARDLIERQGGALTASSRRGKGSVFTVTLPAAPPPGA